MTSIRTTAEFDADGRFTGRIEESVSPGRHPVVVEVDEVVDKVTAESSIREMAAKPAVERLGELLVFTGEICVDLDVFRRQLDDDRAFHLLYGPFE